MPNTPPDRDSGRHTTDSITRRIDSLPGLTRGHVTLAVLLTTLFFFDVVDLTSFAYVAPALLEEWDLSIGQLGTLTSTAFAGMFAGGLVGGWLADRFGRRPMVLTGVLLFSAASLAAAFAPNPELLGACRFVTGFGLQMTTGAVLVIVSETFPKPFRGRVMALILGVSLVGAPVIALIARLVVPIGLWHIVFIVGALGVVPAAFAFRTLPESPRWLALNGQGDRADAQLSEYERQAVAKYGALLPVTPDEATAAEPGTTSVLAIFTSGLFGRTVVAVLAFCGLVLLNYGFGAWLPTILVERGYPQDDALTFAFILSFASMIGALVAIMFIDRIERKTAIAAGVLIMAVCYLAVGFVESVPVLLIAGFAANMLAQTVSATMYSYVPEMFPTQVRGVGAGLANSMGRFAGIFSSIILAAVLSAFAVEGVFLYLTAVAVVMAAVVCFGPVIGIRASRAQHQRERALTTSDQSALTAVQPFK
ncbi:MFS transporter [Streptomyces shenzhenensis]|uniref:MFS transporter n=1 Tax=Streptomyces shenzhenensis TaxID=943815 RepID=UPI0033F3A849